MLCDKLTTKCIYAAKIGQVRIYHYDVEGVGEVVGAESTSLEEEGAVELRLLYMLHPLQLSEARPPHRLALAPIVCRLPHPHLHAQMTSGRTPSC